MRIVLRRFAPILAVLLLSPKSALTAEETVGVTEVTPNVLVFATSTGNVVTSIGPEGALLVGTPSAESTQQISDIISKKTNSPVRYVVISPEDTAHSEGDAGWGRRGAFVVMQEKALERLGGHVMGPPQPLPPRLVTLGVDRPRVAFSEVITFDLNGEAVHVVHQKPAYSDADALTHFHQANLIYLGEVFPGDGYPKIDSAQHGNLEGVMGMLAGWTGPNFRVAPARGKVTNGTEVKAFLEMITAVRERVKKILGQGKTESDVVEARPTADFDSKWGHGRVSAEEFVREICASIRDVK